MKSFSILSSFVGSEVMVSNRVKDFRALVYDFFLGGEGREIGLESELQYNITRPRVSQRK